MWIPCEVVRSPFPDERTVRLDSPDGAWAGFVGIALLRDDVTDGPTAVRATIVAVEGSTILARLPGQTHVRPLTCPSAGILLAD